MLFGLLIVPLLVSGSSCPVYKCGKSSTTTGRCISFSNSTGVDNYVITPCIQGLACDFIPEQSSECQYPTDYEPRYPGEYCAEDQDCASYNCFGSKCLGLSAGSACSSTSACNAGYYCGTSPSVCTAQLAVGATCTRTIQCINSAVCDAGVCTTYFSKALGAASTLKDYRGIALACSSGFISNGVCAAAPVSNSTSVISCSFNTSCYAKDGVNKKTCLCSYDGKSYCPLFEGDSQVQQLIQGMPTINSYSSQCHTLNRFGYACYVNMPSTALSYYLTWAANAELYWGNEWVYQKTTQKCVNETIQAPYLNIVKQSTSQYYQCPMYSKTNTTARWSANQCIFAANDIYYDNHYTTIQVNDAVCPSGQACYASPNSGGNVTCTSVALRYAGDYCSASSQCQSGNCTNDACVGISLDQKCVNPTDCNPGLFCNTTSSKCEYNVAVGGNCSNFYHCQNNLTCNLNTCVPVYSLANGDQVDNSTTYGYNKACASGFAAYDTTTYSRKCAIAPVSNNSVNALCNHGTSCSDTTGVYTKGCQCGTDGNAYCPTFEGDPAPVKMIQYFKKIANYTTKCNSANIDAYCFKKSSTMMKYYNYYYTYYTEYMDGPTLKNTEDSFLADFYFPEYWSAYNSIHSSSYGSTLAMSIAALIAFTA
ncbi:hypothetical protein SteCoe_10330 [Stentor coeruleus]|uniref:Dickkopf N-terminal cysteine-rich domain-containing protein n=1 Tax=Stentor coeruleus TaxID=5963 RepID=A0A1R2CFP9_9CILI|nr:hypothetical protein SteCoe_10330 [Stentor coeruleus]